MLKNRWEDRGALKKSCGKSVVLQKALPEDTIGFTGFFQFSLHFQQQSLVQDFGVGDGGYFLLI